jgi:polyvinyl alcohol dehydrogenase (cytochrome)
MERSRSSCPGLRLALFALFLDPSLASAQAIQGIALFEQNCAACHGATSGDSRAPDRETLRRLSPEAIVTALTTGSMAANATALNDAQKRAIAEQLTGRPVGALQAGQASSMKNRCQVTPFVDPSTSPMWNGWGVDAGNSRFQPAAAAGLTPALVPRLTLKWAFGFPNGTSAYGQPTLAAGRVFVGSDSGFVYSLDAKSGCVYWSFQTQAGVRSAISIGPVKTVAGQRYALYFGDLKANVYAIDAESAAVIWTTRADTHPLARITGAPALEGGRLYVTVSSLEEAAGANPKYPCCTFRGSLMALDAATGLEYWKSYPIDQAPKPTKKNSIGTQLWGPSGAAIWSSPAVDVRRGAVYVATGNAYTEPAAEQSDSVAAFDLKTGKALWFRQLTPRDSYVVGCGANAATRDNCPEDTGPDFDFGNSPILRTLPDGRSVITLGQKSGVAWGLDPDNHGNVIWQKRVGRGSALGGLEWGSGADDQNGYFPVADAGHGPDIAGGLWALKLTTGEVVWSTRPPAMDCNGRPCVQAQSAAVSVIPGVVFSGTTSGMMRAYSTTDGKVIWEYNSAQAYVTVNGVPARGGAINGPGPTVAAGMLFFNSGYAYLGGGLGGNVLLAFGVE